MKTSRYAIWALLVAACGGTTPSPASPEPPLPGAVQWTGSNGGNGHWYAVVVVPRGLSWEEARAEAERAGGHLATIGSAAENEHVASVAATARDAWTVNAVGALIGPWLGGYQEPGSAEPADGWRWVTGEPWAFEAWRTGTDPQPNDSDGVEDRLVYLEYDAPGSAWNDYPASPDGSEWRSHIRGYVVEIE